MTTIKSILELSIFQNAKILAGKKAVNKNIHRVSFSDCPVRLENMGERVILPGDFFIGSLYVFKDDYDKLFHNIQFYIEYGASGMCIINEYFKVFPKEIIRYADENDFVIFIIDKEIPYGDIINEITNLIIINQNEEIKEMKIDNLIYGKVNERDIINISKSILKYNFKRYYVIYTSDNFKSNNQREIFKNTVNKKCNNLFIRYKMGFFIIAKNEEEQKYCNIENLISVIKDIDKGVSIGISSIFNRIELLKSALIESLTSYDFSSIIGKDIVYYNELKRYKLLYQIKDSKEYKSMFSELVEPILKYDLECNSELMSTIVKYIECDGDFKMTSKKLFQHENTIRYRIRKVQDILGLQEKQLEFIECICLIEKMYMLSKEPNLGQ